MINNDPKKLRRSIDWDGSLTNKGPVTHPSINCMKDHFEQLYTPDDALEIDKIIKLTTNIYIYQCLMIQLAMVK